MRSDSFELRKKAVAYFEHGHGYKAVASHLGLPRDSVRQWLYTYNSLGKEALFVREKKFYNYDLKLAAVRDVIENGMTKSCVMQKYGIKSKTPLESWCRLYRKGGPDALLPKPKGRPKAQPPVYATREEELEARIKELELELEIQKRINALADEIEQRRQTR